MVIEFVSTYLFTKRYKKKYQMTVTKAEFFHNFYRYIGIIAILSLTLHLIDGWTVLTTKIEAGEMVYTTIYYSFDKEELPSIFEDTIYAQCEDSRCILDTHIDNIEDKIKQELISNIMIIITEYVSSIIFMEMFMKDGFKVEE